MKQELEKIKQNFNLRIKQSNTLEDWQKTYKAFLGKKGALAKIFNVAATFDMRKRKVLLKKLGKLQAYIEKALEKKKKALSKKEAPLSRLDLSLPGKKIPLGHLHPLTHALSSVERVFESMGFSIFLSPELETEFYNFDALNIPPDHPARDLWDTFWLAPGQQKFDIQNQTDKHSSNNSTANRLLLRTHTTAMQLHYMQKHNPPFRIITPGRCFRYEASDSSHDIQFYQVDGLVVDQNISIANFKAIIEELFKRLFSSSIKIRMRPGYFPFVEPGFEIDIACYKCQGKNCPICHGTGWLEIMGAGMVHPAVFKRAGYNPLNWQGFAFGMGIDRIAMIKYGIDDIRLFYQNDLRFLKQF